MMPRLPDGRWPAAAGAILLGGLAGFGQAPWSLWPVTLLALGALFWWLRDVTSARRAAWLGWAAGAGYVCVSLFWIVEPFLVDLPRHGWMAPFALFFMAAGFGLFWALAFWAGYVVAGRGRHVAATAITLTLTEMTRGVILTGFPWATIGHVWIGHDVMQLAAWGGAGLLTLLTLLIAAIPAALPRPALGVSAALLLLGIAWGGGAARLASVDLPAFGPAVRVIQPNAAQHLKWDPAYIPTFLNRQLTMTAAPQENPLALIVWPETSITTRLGQAGSVIAAMADAAGGVPVVFGANQFVDGAFRNALAVMGGSGQLHQVYHKHHLVPFGEYVPLGDWLSRFGIRGLAAREGGGFAPGPGPTLIDVPGLGRALPLICYELIFPRHVHMAERPDLIIQITNDAWFGNISGPYQHLAQARLRAVEQGIGLVRSANTGVSAVIDAVGNVTKQAPLNEAGYLDTPLPSALPATPYSKTGDLPIALVICLLLFLFRIVPYSITDIDGRVRPD